MVDMWTKSQKTVLIVGVAAIFLALLVVSMPTSRTAWVPQGEYIVSTDLTGNPITYPFGPTPHSPEYIAKQIGYDYVSLEAFQRRYSGDRITVKGRFDGRVMYLDEDTKYFTLQDTSPNLLFALEAVGIEQRDGTITMKYAQSDIFPWLFAIEVCVWVLFMLFITYPRDDDGPMPGQVIYYT